MTAEGSSATKTEAIAPVSVVIPCFRCEETIGRALRSVAAQTLLPAEIILVDDCSADDTLRTLHEISGQHPEDWIKVIALAENSGAAAARNRGWDAASQPLLAFLDADDAWHPRKLEIQYEYMRRHPEVALCGHESTRLPSEDKLAEMPEPPADLMPQTVGRHELLRSNRFITPSVMLRRDIPFRFRDGRRHMEDHLLWMLIVCNGLRIDKLPVALAYTFKAAYAHTGLSSQMLPMAMGDLANYRHLRKEGLIGPVLAWALYGFSLLKTVRRLLLAAIGRYVPTPDHP